MAGLLIYYNVRMSKIITTDDLRTEIGKDLTAMGAVVVDGVNSYIESTTGRTWGEEAEEVERHDFRPTVYLRNMDVTQIISVKTGYPQQTQTSLTSDSYYWTRQGKLVLALAGCPQFVADYLEVDYKHQASVPQDLKLAALALAAEIYNWANTGQRDPSRVTVGSYTIDYSNRKNSSQTTSDTYVAVIKSYRKQRV